MCQRLAGYMDEALSLLTDAAVGSSQRHTISAQLSAPSMPWRRSGWGSCLRCWFQPLNQPPELRLVHGSIAQLAQGLLRDPTARHLRSAAQLDRHLD
jgi:hypothetical protein